jgi:hypothetical protein
MVRMAQMEELLAQLVAKSETKETAAAVPEIPEPNWGQLRRSMPDPEPFIGDGGRSYGSWRMEVSVVAEVDAEAFRSARARVFWGFGMLRGKARTGLEAWTMAYNQRTTFKAADFEEFLSACDASFDDRDQKRRRQFEFETMRQGRKPFREFIAEWQQALVATGVALTDDHKERYLLDAISPELRSAAEPSLLLIQSGFHDRLRFLKVLADSREARGMQRPWAQRPQQPQQQPRLPQPQQPRLPQPQQQPAAQQISPADQMDWTPTAAAKVRAKWVPREELDRRRAANLCTRCGGSDHRSRQCGALPPLFPRGANRTVAASVKVAPAPDGIESEAEWGSVEEIGSEPVKG